MAAHAESPSSLFDTAKLTLAVALLIAGIGGYHYFTEYPALYRVLAIIGVSLVSILLLFTTAVGRMLWVFTKEARVEVRKVIWPTRQETVQTTLVVVALVFLVGLILWFLDMLLFWAITHLTGQVK